jgi:hypothetical protein
MSAAPIAPKSASSFQLSHTILSASGRYRVADNCVAIAPMTASDAQIRKRVTL